MTEEQTKPPENKAFITTDYRDIFGYDNIFELDLNFEFIERLLDNGVVYVEAGTEHQSRLSLIQKIVKNTRKIGAKEIGELAIEELKKQNNGK